MTLVVVVVVVVVVVGGGITFIHGHFREPMYGFEKIKSKTPCFSFLFQNPMYGLEAHVWPREREGVTPHSEIIVGD